MVHTKLSEFNAAVGEEIGLALGAQFISSYQKANPSDVASYFVGRNILDRVLAQPGCVGMRFYNAYNEAGEKTLVYVGVTAAGNDMLTVTTVNPNGQLDVQKGIVADRIKSGGFGEHDNWWETE
jgi:hypothetical protein